MNSVAIVGAGPGGLVLARVLQRHGIPATVYERETGSLHRSQGGSLDLHTESGQYALREAGLEAEFLAAARYDDQDMIICDPALHIWCEHRGDETHDRPEIDRGVLREMLLNSLHPGTVRWDHGVRQVAEVCPGLHRLTFANGGEAESELVVGADGAWSRVRPLLSNAQPVYLGVTFFELVLPQADLHHPEISKRVGRGHLLALGDGKAIIAQRNGDGSIRVYMALKVPEAWQEESGIPFDRPAEARNQLLACFEGWAPDLLDIVLGCDETLVPRKLYHLTPGHRWESKPGVTLIGDAAHLMSPFAGEGANQAMWDGVDLALKLAGTSDWNMAIRDYENQMFERSRVATQESAENLNLAFSTHGAQLLAERMNQYG